MFEEFCRIDAAVVAYFKKSKLATGGARSEVWTAAMYPDARRAIWCEINGTPLTELEALLIRAVRCGRRWADLAVNDVHISQESAPLHVEEELDENLQHEWLAEALAGEGGGVLL